MITHKTEQRAHTQSHSRSFILACMHALICMYTCAPRSHTHAHLLCTQPRICIRTHICTLTCDYKFMYMRTQPHTRTCIYAQSIILTHTYLRSRMHVGSLIHARSCTQSPTHTLQCTLMRVNLRTHSRADSPVHSYSCTCTCARVPCAYIFVCVPCAYIFVCACTKTRACASIHGQLWEHLFTHTYIHTHAHKHGHTPAHTRTWTHSFTHMHAAVHSRADAWHTYINIDTFGHTRQVYPCAWATVGSPLNLIKPFNRALPQNVILLRGHRLNWYSLKQRSCDWFLITE